VSSGGHGSNRFQDHFYCDLCWDAWYDDCEDENTRWYGDAQQKCWCELRANKSDVNEDKTDLPAAALAAGPGHIHWPLAAGLRWEVVPPPPNSKHAFCSLLHGDSDMFFVYALHIAFQLKAWAHKTAAAPADRVLLVGDSQFFEEPGSRNALYSAGWTHIVPVDLIDGAHLSYARRHNAVFTKLRALGLPYEKVLLLDLDLLVRDNIYCLFDVLAPAAKYHGDRWQHESLLHGELLPAAVTEGDWWCPNAGVMRLDPHATQEERLKMMHAMEHEISAGVGLTKSNLPEQDYLAQRLSGWRLIDSRFNLELYEVTSFDQIQSASVVHFSGKSSCLQPTHWLDVDPEGLQQFVEKWCNRHTSLEHVPIQVFIFACREWREVLDLLVTDSEGWTAAAQDAVQQVLKRLRCQAPEERSWHMEDRHCIGSAQEPHA